ncbi:MAG: hypothetical protein ACREA9_21860, partial [Pyrinomonadaceae bacterium]
MENLPKRAKSVDAAGTEYACVGRSLDEFPLPGSNRHSKSTADFGINLYKYGINWKMSAKTILVQMHHKAAAFESIGKKLVLAVQTEFFRYIST